MVYSPNLANPSYQSRVESRSITQMERVYARVVYVVLDENSKYYEENGGVEAINGIKYRLLETNYNEEDIDSLPFAYSGQAVFKTIPLVDEIVEIITEPGIDLENSSNNQKTYYSRIVNIWNNPVHNSYPDQTRENTEAFLDENVVEPIGFKNNASNPGDILIEGRQGQLIRFSGLVEQAPYISIRNGQVESNDITLPVREDVNSNESNIFITSNTSVPLQSSNKIETTYRETSDKPVSINSYQGRQLVVSTGRTVIDSKDDDIILISKDSINLSSDRIHLNSKNYIGIDSSKIYIGGNSFNENEPLVLGGKNNEWLGDLIDLLKTFMQDIQRTGTSGASIAAVLMSSGVKLTAKLLDLEKRIQNNTLISKKTFTE